MPKPRLHQVSKLLQGQGLIEQPNRTIQRRRTQVHVPLRHAQFPMSGELQNRSWRCSAHRQVRAERVTQDVYPLLRQLRSARRPQHAILHHLPSQWPADVLAQHVRTPQMPMVAERSCKSDREVGTSFGGASSCSGFIRRSNSTRSRPSAHRTAVDRADIQRRP